MNIADASTMGVFQRVARSRGAVLVEHALLSCVVATSVFTFAISFETVFPTSGTASTVRFQQNNFTTPDESWYGGGTDGTLFDNAATAGPPPPPPNPGDYIVVDGKF